MPDIFKGDGGGWTDVFTLEKQDWIDEHISLTNWRGFYKQELTIRAGNKVQWSSVCLACLRHLAGYYI